MAIYPQEAHHPLKLNDLMIEPWLKNGINKKITWKKRNFQELPSILPAAANIYSGKEYLEPLLL